MYNIYFNDGVNAVSLVHSCDTYEDAEKWVKNYVKDKTPVDKDHHCTEDVFNSSKVASLEVYKGEPIVEIDGEPLYKEPLYTSDYFYVE